MAASLPADDRADLERAQAALAGDEDAFRELFERHRARLERMVQIRMDPRIRQRVGASDVLQEACIEAADRLGEYVADPEVPFFLWLRFLTGQRLAMLHRHHMGAKKRSVGRQVSADRGAVPGATSVVLADRLMAAGTTPTQAVQRHELRAQVEAALDAMKAEDREILVLRHFEELTNAEAAGELGIDTSAASKRYVRALRRLKEITALLRDPTGESDET